MQRLYFTLLVIMLFLLGNIGFSMTDKDGTGPEAISWKKSNDYIEISSGIDFYWMQSIESSPAETSFASGKIVKTLPWYNIVAKDKAFGYGTYHILLKDLENDTYAIRLDVVYSAYKVWANDSLIHSSGVFSTTKKKEKYHLGVQIIPLKPTNGKLDIYIEVSNHSNGRGGITKPIIFGKHARVSKRQTNNMLLEISMMAIILITALYSALLSIISPNDRITFLFFTLFCFAVVVRSSCINTMIFIQIFPDISSEAFEVIRYSGFFLAVSTGFEYFRRIARIPMKNYVKYIVHIPILVCCNLLIFSPRTMHSNISIFVQITGFILIFWGLIKFVKKINAGDKTVILHAISLCIFIVVFTHDSLAANNIIPYHYYQLYGFLIFAITQILHLSLERNRIYLEIQKKQSDIEKISLYSKSRIEINDRLSDGLRAIKRKEEEGKNEEKINELLKNISVDRSFQGEEKVILNRLEDANKDFLEKLKVRYPELTKGELRLCEHLKADLSSKRIADLRNISPDSVKRMKNRLRKKFHLEKGADLYDFIKEI